MQLQFSKKVCRCLGCAVQEIKNTELTQELRLPEGMPDIGRVLISWGQVMLRSKQWQSGMIELNGGIKIWTLYAPDDGSQPRTAESWIPFQLRWDAEPVDREGPVRLIPRLRFVDSRSISPRKMLLRAGVGVLAQGFYEMEPEVPMPKDVPDDLQILKHTYPVRLATAAGEKVFLLDEEVDLTGSGIAGCKIISYTVCPEVTEKRVLSDKAVFKGNCNLHLVIQDRENRLQCRNFELPFSQLADLDEACSSVAQADIQLAVTDLEADLNDSDQLRVKCGMVAQYLVDDSLMLELAEDAYSPRRKVTFETLNLPLPAVLEERTEQITASQTLPGYNGQTVDSCFYPDFPRIRRNADAMDLELPGMYQTLFYGEDGSLQSASLRWQGNMSVCAEEHTVLLPIPQQSHQVQVMTGADGTVLSSPINVLLRTQSGQGMEMIGSMEIGELQESDPQRPSVILQRCGNDSLWNIAKSCGSSVAAIEQANGIAGEAGKGQMILIPVI